MAKTPMRGIRVPDNIWQPARNRAQREGTNVTAAIVRFLTRYGKHTSTIQAPPDSEERS